MVSYLDFFVSGCVNLAVLVVSCVMSSQVVYLLVVSGCVGCIMPYCINWHLTVSSGVKWCFAVFPDVSGGSGGEV